MGDRERECDAAPGTHRGVSGERYRGPVPRELEGESFDPFQGNARPLRDLRRFRPREEEFPERIEVRPP
jgi:hypothetical protein